MRFSSLYVLMTVVLAAPNLEAGGPVVPPSQSLPFKELPEITIGSLEAPVEVIMYFSPTCTHCADYEGGIFLEIKEEFIESGQVRFIMRLLPFHRLDYAVAKLIWSRGHENVIELTQFFLAHQKDWLDPILEENPKKREKLLQVALKQTAEFLEMSIKTLRETLNIQGSTEDAFVKLFALRNGFTIKEIKRAAEDDPALEDALTANHLQAASDFGKPLDYVPAFLVNGKVAKDWPKPVSLRRHLNKIKAK